MKRLNKSQWADMQKRETKARQDPWPVILIQQGNKRPVVRLELPRGRENQGDVGEPSNERSLKCKMNNAINPPTEKHGEKESVRDEESKKKKKKVD